MADETKAMNLVQKLASIRRELTHIEKKGRNEFQKYDYLRAEDIAGEMGDRLAAMNVIVARRNLQFVQDNITIKKDNGDERTDVHVIVTLDYVFLDGDAVEEILNDSSGKVVSEVVVASIGEGRDSGDKAVAKAMTNALKYALTQPLMMRVGDDPEADAPHDKPETRKPRQLHQDTGNVRPTPQNGSNAQERASTVGLVLPVVPLAEQGADATLLKTTLDSLIRKVYGKIGEELGKKWLKAATADMGVTSKTATLAQLLALSERASTLTKPAEPATEDDDLNW